jgi:excisionase family DNA binding protein
VQYLEGFPGSKPEGFFVDESEKTQRLSRKTSPTSTKVQHVGVLLSVKEASKRIGVSSMTITRWCESGKLPAITKAYGKRTTWLISPQALELLHLAENKHKSEKTKPSLPWQDYQAAWITAMSRGILSGKVYSKRTIDDYTHYVKAYAAKHRVLTAEKLQSELMIIPALMFAKREKLYKAILCFSKFLIHVNALPKGFIEDIKPLYPKRHLPPKRNVVNKAEIQALLKVCETTQERLIVSLLMSTGLRASEACLLRWGDIDMENDCLIVRLGKGNKTRKVGISPSLVEAIKEHKTKVFSGDKQPVLLNRKGKQMDRSGLYQRLQRLGEAAGVTVSPHALRRAFVTINANKGRPLQMLQIACGHSDIKTTMSYCRTSEQEVIESMKGWD